MKKKLSGWRCPYCDGLNDWQDSICQICGDGKREDEESQMKPERAHEHEEKSLGQSGKQKQENINHTEKTDTVAEKAPKSDPEQEATEVYREKPGKKHRARRFLRIAEVLGILFCLFFVYCFVSSRKLAYTIDLEMLEEIPSDLTAPEAAEWFKEKGYTVNPVVYDDGENRGVYEGRYTILKDGTGGAYLGIETDYREQISYFDSHRWPNQMVLNPLYRGLFNVQLKKRLIRAQWKQIGDWNWKDEYDELEKEGEVWQAANGSRCYFRNVGSHAGIEIYKMLVYS